MPFMIVSDVITKPDDKSIGSRPTLTLRNEISLSVNWEGKNAFFADASDAPRELMSQNDRMVWILRAQKLNFEVGILRNFPHSNEKSGYYENMNERKKNAKKVIKRRKSIIN